MTNAVWRFGGHRAITLDRPRLMAIMNLTPDSFSDGGMLDTQQRVVEAAQKAVADGADLLDLGGESTRPGAQRVTVNEQIRRVIPAIEAIRSSGITLPISIDTTRSQVVLAAIAAADGDGATIVNDVSGGEEDPGLFAVIAEHGLGVVIMHRLRPPGADSYADQYETPPVYHDVVAQVRDDLVGRVQRAMETGIERDAILVDPGLGFGKTVEQNLDLIRGTKAFLGLGAGVLSAASRKSFVGRVAFERDSDPDERKSASAAFSVCHYLRGARVFRVHDVALQRVALQSAAAIRGEVGSDNWV